MSLPLGQLTPPALDRARYDRDLAAWQARLQSFGLDYTAYADALNPYPFALSEAAALEMLAFQASLHRALTAIVKHYPRDPRLQAVVALSPEERRLVDEWWDLPYAVGSHRPDFLHLRHGGFQISEINARFALNGYLISWILNRAAEGFFEHAPTTPWMADLLPSLSQRLGDKVGLLKQAEGGWDIHLLAAWWGKRCEFRAPGQIADCTAAVLELHQNELCRLSADERQALRQARLLNDLRTVLIVHDKRLLALLSTSEVLSEYLDAEDWQRIRRHVIPTWVAGLAPEQVRIASREATGWLVKPPRLGKGQGFLVAHNMAPAEWRAALEKLPPDWILQPFVDQATFPIATIQHDELVTVPMKISGVLPALDDRAFGPGIYRASPDDIVAVSRGGTILTPVIAGDRP